MMKRIFYAAVTATLGMVLVGVFGCGGSGGIMGASGGPGAGQSAGCGYPQTNCPQGYVPAPGQGGQCMPQSMANQSGAPPGGIP